MKTKMIVWSIALMLMGTGTAVAYHLMEPVGPLATDNMATQWENHGNSLALDVCESQGLDDKINPNPTKLRGEGGLCYASSWHPGVKGIDPKPLPTDPKKKSPRYSSNDINNTLVTEWSVITPTCEPLEAVLDLANNNAIAGPNPALACPTEPLPGALGTWFARVGNNANGCPGSWGDSFYYVEAVAWWLGSGSNLHGFPSGHVTFFVDDPGTAGSYDYAQDIVPDQTGTPAPSYHAWCS